jgi:hypothetical protein
MDVHFQTPQQRTMEVHCRACWMSIEQSLDVQSISGLDLLDVHVTAGGCPSNGQWTSMSRLVEPIGCPSNDQWTSTHNTLRELLDVHGAFDGRPTHSLAGSDGRPSSTPWTSNQHLEEPIWMSIEGLMDVQPSPPWELIWTSM